jgi:hypothetical protein
MPNEASKLQCERCGETFQSKAELQEHAQNCTGARQQQGGQVRGAGGQSQNS